MHRITHAAAAALVTLLALPGPAKADYTPLGLDACGLLEALDLPTLLGQAPAEIKALTPMPSFANAPSVLTTCDAVSAGGDSVFSVLLRETTAEAAAGRDAPDVDALVEETASAFDAPDATTRVDIGAGGYHVDQGIVVQLGFFAREGWMMIILSPGFDVEMDKAQLETIAEAVLAVVEP